MLPDWWCFSRGPRSDPSRCRKERVWSQAGRKGLSRLLSAHHSCLWGLWVNNSNSDANGLRQHCRRYLFLHSGVSIKFYWLLPKSRTASCYRSGLRLLQDAKLDSGGSEPCWKQFSINRDREGAREQREQRAVPCLAVWSQISGTRWTSIKNYCLQHSLESGRPWTRDLIHFERAHTYKYTHTWVALKWFKESQGKTVTQLTRSLVLSVTSCRLIQWVLTL